MVNFNFRPPPEPGEPIPADYLPPISESVDGNPYIGRIAICTEDILTELQNLSGPDDIVISADDALVLPLMHRRLLSPTPHNLQLALSVARKLRGRPTFAALMEVSLEEPYIKQQYDSPLLAVRLNVDDPESIDRLRFEQRVVDRRLRANAKFARRAHPTIRVLETPSADFARTAVEKLLPFAMQGVELAPPDAYLAPR